MKSNYLHALTLVCSILCAGVARAASSTTSVTMTWISSSDYIVSQGFDYPSEGMKKQTWLLDDFVKSGKFCEIYGHGYILQTVIEQRCRYCGIHRNDDLEDRKRCELRERRYRP